MMPTAHPIRMCQCASLLVCLVLLQGQLLLGQVAPAQERSANVERQLLKIQEQLAQLTRDNIRLMQENSELIGDNTRLMKDNSLLMQERQRHSARLQAVMDSMTVLLYWKSTGATTGKSPPRPVDVPAERQRLEREIAALILLGMDLSDLLPQSLLERAERMTPAPANLPELRLYRYLLGQLQRGRALLELPPDAAAPRMALELEGMVIDGDRFPGLYDDRPRLIAALNGYCERTAQLARVIRNAGEGRSNEERVNYLDRYQATQYPYLQQQMARARANPGFRLQEKRCP